MTSAVSCMQRSFLIKPPSELLTFSRNCWRNARLPLNVHTQTMAGSSKEMPSTPLLSNAGNTLSAKNLPARLGRKPTARQRASSELSWKCGTSSTTLLIVNTENKCWHDLLTYTTPSKRTKELTITNLMKNYNNTLKFKQRCRFLQRLLQNTQRNRRVLPICSHII